jgi:hypothetical protein
MHVASKVFGGFESSLDQRLFGTSSNFRLVNYR